MLDGRQFASLLLWIFIVPILGTALIEMDPTYGTTSGSKGARWVCPNDRQLALRAKLRTGWSVKSGSFDSRFTDFTYSSSCPGNLNATSSSSSSSKPFALSDEERSTIIQVIQRAEALDVSEQERVGRLVERLENMKRNVSSVTTTRSSGRSCGSRCSGSNGCVCSCALCGEKFTVLGAGPSLCHDCRKYICQKCGIETSPTYLLTPSGTAGSSSSGSGPGSGGGGIATPAAQHQHNVSQHLRLKSPNASNKWFLCRICAETREMWKKSGAWFFKGLPKYVLPEKKDRGRSRAGSRASGWTLTGGTKSLEPPEPDSSSDEEPTRRMTRTRSLLSATGEIEVVSPSEQGGGGGAAAGGTSPLAQTSEIRSPHNQPSTRNSSTTSENERHASVESNPPEVATSDTTTLPQLGNRGRLSSISSARSTRSSNKSGVTIGTSNNGQRSNSSSSGRHRKSVENERDNEEERESGDFSSTSVTQVHPPSAGNNSASSSSISVINTSRKESPGAASESTTSFALVNHHHQQQQQHPHHERNRPSRDARMPNLNHPEQLPRIDHMGMVETAAGYGTLEISLRYEPAGQCLQCKVLRARGLRAMDIHGLADPFCKLNILPRTSSATTKLIRTKTVHKTRDPEFNEQLNFYGITESDMKSGRALHVLIQQDDQVARDFLGEARFQLYEVPPYQTRYYNVFLEDHYPVSQEEKIWGEDNTNGRGQIQLTLSYSTRRRVLLVTVERAINLLSMDSNGFSDPFVKLCLTKEQQREDVCSGVVQHHHHHQQQLPQRQSSFGQSTIVNSVAKKASRKLAMSSPRSSASSSSSSSSNVHSTSVKWKTLNPEWNEEFAFETRLTDLTGLALVMSVWDKDFGKSNDYLGGLTLSCSSKGARLRHWIDMIKYPDHNHRATHNLIEDQIPID